MSDFLNNIRKAETKRSVNERVVGTVAILLLGIALGVLSKYLDCTPSNELPFLIEYLDIRNFLGRFAVWIFLAVCISVYSGSPARAAMNVFVFFTGMVASYYLYSRFIAGFFPRSYALIWVGPTAISPFLAVLCWYAKGNGKLPLLLSAGIIAVLFNMAFGYGWLYFEVRYLPELLVFICGAVVLRRRSVKETTLMLGIGLILAFAMNLILPFHFG